MLAADNLGQWSLPFSLASSDKNEGGSVARSFLRLVLREFRVPLMLVLMNSFVWIFGSFQGYQAFTPRRRIDHSWSIGRHGRLPNGSTHA